MTLRLLLDTHIAIWALLGSSRLSDRAADLIGERSNEVFVSVVSLWEIAIKRSTNRADAPKLTRAEVARSCRAAGYGLLHMTVAHAIAVESLPVLHRDPFDRLLVAQASTEPLALLTHDTIVARYGDGIMLV